MSIIVEKEDKVKKKNEHSIIRMQMRVEEKEKQIENLKRDFD